MIELFALPCLVGAFLSRVVFIVKHCERLVIEPDTSFNPWEFSTKAKDNQEKIALYAAAKKRRHDRKDRAGKKGYGMPARCLMR